MPRATLAGHPLHPQLVGLPIGLVPFAWVMDLMYAATDEKKYAQASKYATIGAVIGATGAAVAGVLDYLTIPSRTHEKQLGNTHAILNTGVLLLAIASLARRKDAIPRSKAEAATLGTIATLGLVISQWYGGDLVYEHGMRVKGVQEHNDADEWKPPADSKIAQTANRFAELMPKWGPTEKAA